MGASFWSSPSGDLSCHFDPSPLGRELHHHDEVAGRWCSAPPLSSISLSDHVPPLSPMDCNPLHRFLLHSQLHRQQYSPTPVCFKQTVLDIQVWTDGSVSSLFGPGGAGVYVTCSKCNTSYSLSFSTGPIASSFTAETFSLKQISIGVLAT